MHEVPLVESMAVEHPEILEELAHQAERLSRHRHVMSAPWEWAHLVAAPARVAAGVGFHFEQLELAEAAFVQAPGGR